MKRGDLVKCEDKNYIVVDYSDFVSTWFFQYFIWLNGLVRVVSCDENYILNEDSKFNFLRESTLKKVKGNKLEELNVFLLKLKLMGTTIPNGLEEDVYKAWREKELLCFNNKYEQVLNAKQGTLYRVDGVNLSFFGWEKKAVDSFFLNPAFSREPKVVFGIVDDWGKIVYKRYFYPEVGFVPLDKEQICFEIRDEYYDFKQIRKLYG